jgi:ribosomal protein S18 acetylase RimI-like enzyme
MLPGVKVRKVERQDIPKLAHVFALSFNEDPVLSWIIRQDNKRLEALTDLFKFYLNDAYQGGAETTTNDLMACAIWVPPEKENHSISLSWISKLPRYFHWAGLGRVRRFLSFVDACEGKRPSEPYYYLDSIGVDPDHQGKGYGSMLLKYTLDHFDSEGLPAYLESSNIRNNPLYERYGFRTLSEIHLSGGPTLWCMWREPKTRERAM